MGQGGCWGQAAITPCVLHGPAISKGMDSLVREGRESPSFLCQGLGEQYQRKGKHDPAEKHGLRADGRLPVWLLVPPLSRQTGAHFKFTSSQRQGMAAFIYSHLQNSSQLEGTAQKVEQELRISHLAFKAAL